MKSDEVIKRTADKYILADGSSPTGNTPGGTRPTELDTCLMHLGRVIKYFNIKKVSRQTTIPWLKDAVEFYESRTNVDVLE